MSVACYVCTRLSEERKKSDQTSDQYYNKLCRMGWSVWWYPHDSYSDTTRPILGSFHTAFGGQRCPIHAIRFLLFDIKL